METNQLYLYNSITGKKELFEPINNPYVGMYVCGPTVYGDAHLGHARPAITFDVLFRYLKHVGYKVRYVRNITDVGHLENDADSGEDKIAKKARLEQLEPMEIVQYYTDRYHANMQDLNVLSPSIEPKASGHIIEQIEFIERIIKNGYGYVENGSVYFDVLKYNEKHNYGILSGRNIDELINNTRTLEGQEEKKNSFDFALWKKAQPQHIMRWNSPWSVGFPGWHLECSAMGEKYLGEVFDIHGGGMDLKFPHHECEIAQSVAANNKHAVKHWVHNNLITINGQKMSKSLNNFITLDEVFSGKNALLNQAYSPMTVRFFILQAHYGGTLDFSNEALLAAEKAMARMCKAFDVIDKLVISNTSSIDFNSYKKRCYDALNDDLNTPILLAVLFDVVKSINLIKEGKETIDAVNLSVLKEIVSGFFNEILGLINQSSVSTKSNSIDTLMEVILELRKNAKTNKDYATADYIRNKLSEVNIKINDTKDGANWFIE
ncbi:MAG: cysteine--tRNA ligase [Bacteroidetes bacterium GWE2_29_8]|nr:MAG: cysteine--tRNA ligase [Bacteroidetes bacterium GWE2_29_8]OFY24389.1 MAG: cysteine--tRNA ligase [Bacteroidetes bacterium GWF2_29_10]